MHNSLRKTLLLLALTACSSSASSPFVAVQVDSTIPALEGGLVQVAGAALRIPAGALSEDTTITGATRASAGLPEETRLLSEVYEFSPSGLQFNVPATLSIEFAVGATPSDEAVIAYLNEETQTWEPLSDSVVSGSVVTASITHFSGYGVVGPPVFIGQNAALGANYSACGGARPLTRGGFFNDTCPASTVTGSINAVRLQGEAETLFAEYHCTVSYGGGTLNINTNVPDDDGEGFESYSVRMNGDREDGLESDNDYDGAAVRYLHMRDEIGSSINPFVSEGTIWIDYNRNLTYASIWTSSGGISCGFDARE